MQSTSGEDAATKVAAFFVVVLSLAKACFRRDRDTTKMMAGLRPAIFAHPALCRDDAREVRRKSQIPSGLCRDDAREKARRQPWLIPSGWFATAWLIPCQFLSAGVIVKLPVKSLKYLCRKQGIDFRMGRQPVVHQFLCRVIFLIHKQNLAPLAGEKDVSCSLDFFKSI